MEIGGNGASPITSAMPTRVNGAEKMNAVAKRVVSDFNPVAMARSKVMNVDSQSATTSGAAANKTLGRLIDVMA